MTQQEFKTAFDKQWESTFQDFKATSLSHIHPTLWLTDCDDNTDLFADWFYEKFQTEEVDNTFVCFDWWLSADYDKHPLRILLINILKGMFGSPHDPFFPFWRNDYVRYEDVADMISRLIQADQVIDAVIKYFDTKTTQTSLKDRKSQLRADYKTEIIRIVNSFGGSLSISDNCIGDQYNCSVFIPEWELFPSRIFVTDGELFMDYLDNKGESHTSKFIEGGGQFDEMTFYSMQWLVEALPHYKPRFKWVASSDDGCYNRCSNSVFDTKSECYEAMRDVALEKMKWNTDYTDDFDHDNPSAINYEVTFTPDSIVHKSYSGTYTYRIVKA